MAFRTLINTEEKLIAATIAVGAKDGIQQISSAKVGKMMDASTFTVLGFYGNKQGYLDAAAKWVDERFHNRIDELIDEGHTLKEFWEILHEDLMQSPDNVIYYMQYKAVFGTDALENPSKEEWLPKAKLLFRECGTRSEEEYQFLWFGLLLSSLLYAEAAICHPEADTPENRERFFRGINGLLE